MKAVITGVTKFDEIRLIPETEQEHQILDQMSRGQFYSYSSFRVEEKIQVTFLRPKWMDK